MGDTSETNTKVLSRECFYRCGMPIQKNHYMRDMGPFPRCCHQEYIIKENSVELPM